MRYDLAFVLCCCKSFLGDNKRNHHHHNDDGAENDSSGDDDDDDYYHLLGISKDATLDDIKRAYKKQSLLYHPDKLIQRNIPITPALQKKFTNIKEAYDVLCHPNQREIYNVFGKRGIQFMEEPLGSGSSAFLDPNVLLQNFAKSSVWDRSKIFLIFVLILFLLLIQPILICIHVDQIRRDREDDPAAPSKQSLWALTFLPLWIWNALLLFYHVHIISMGPIPRPDHIPIHEVWIDPLPMSKRILSLFRFLLIGLLEVFLVLKWDQVLPNLPYYIIFLPYFVLEVMGLYKKYPLSHMRIVTVHDLEVALGKPFSEFTMAEKQLIAQRYSVVSSVHCPEYYMAYQLKLRSKQEVQQALLRIVFVLLLIVQFDVWQPQHRTPEEENDNEDSQVDDTINYFFIFIPIFLMSILICCTNYYNYIEMRKSVAEKDPTFIAVVPPGPPTSPTSAYGTMEDELLRTNGATTTTATAVNGSTPQNPYHSTLTDSEREVLQQQLQQSRQKMYQKCSIQCFLMILLLLFVCKCNGATFTSFYILLPFLLLAGIILCCIGCAIFGVTEVPTDGIHFQDVVVDPTTNDTSTGNNTNNNTTTSTADHYMNAAEMGTAKPNTTTDPPTTTNNAVPIIIPLPPPAADNAIVTSIVNGNVSDINDSLDNIKPTQQTAESGTTLQSMSESATNTPAVDANGAPKVDIANPVIGESELAISTQLSAQPNLPPPSSLTDGTSTIQPQINELD